MNYKKKLKIIKKEMILREQMLQKKTQFKKAQEEIFDVDYCLCTDSNNQFKTIYATEYEAQKIAKFLYKEQGIYLKVYPCPYSSGWHLTKG
jgi:hypothetical protein